MAIHLFHHGPAAEHIYKPHPHAHQIGFAAAIIGLLSIPLGQFVVPSVIAVVLGVVAIMLSLHPMPGQNARPEGWAGIVCGLMGLVFGLVQLLIMRSL